MIEFNKLPKIKKIEDAYWDKGLYVFLNEDDNPTQVKLPPWMKKALEELMDEAWKLGYDHAQTVMRKSIGM